MTPLRMTHPFWLGYLITNQLCILFKIPWILHSFLKSDKTSFNKHVEFTFPPPAANVTWYSVVIAFAWGQAKRNWTIPGSWKQTQTQPVPYPEAIYKVAVAGICLRLDTNFQRLSVITWALWWEQALYMSVSLVENLRYILHRRYEHRNTVFLIISIFLNNPAAFKHFPCGAHKYNPCSIIQHRSR